MRYLLIFCLIMSTFMAQANTGKTGVGVMIGNPTGINGKHWIEDKEAVDGGIGWSFGKKTEVTLHSDYLFHKKGAFFFNDVHPLDLYFGLGGRMEFASDIELGLRFPVGLTHHFNDQPADFFAEVAPILDFVSKAGMELHLLFGARFYFN
jgi:hypothetical protein